jgi:hypothetical protein
MTNTTLKGLDPRKVYEELGESAVLLCFCPSGEYCHRRIVAEWFEFHLGIIVPELGSDRKDTPNLATPAFDFYVAPVSIGHKQVWNSKTSTWELAS